MICKRATRLYGFLLVPAVIFAATTASGAPQESRGKLGRAVPDEPQPDSKRGAAALQNDFALSDDQLAAAAVIQPVSVEALEAFVPRRLEKFEWLSGEGKTSRVGPASGTIVRAEYVEGERRLKLEFVDLGGMTPSGPYFLDMLPEGDRRQRGTAVLEGLRIAGHPAALVSAPPGFVSTLQLALGPRLRLTLTSSSASTDELRAAAAAFDLDGLAALAKESPPDFRPSR